MERVTCCVTRLQFATKSTYNISSILGALSLTIRVSYNMYSILIVDCGGREGTTNNGSDITLKSNERIRH